MKNAFRRFGILALAVIMCMSTGLVAFAAEVPSPEEVAPAAVGAPLYTQTKTFTTSATFTFDTLEANYDADFVISVWGNSSANYLITMTAANGETAQVIVGGGNGSHTFNMGYAQAGRYTFTIVKNSGTANTVHARVEICD